MSSFSSRIQATLALALLACATTGIQAALTRFEAEVVNTPPTVADSAGYDLTVGNFWAVLGEAGNSNGKVVYTTVQGAPMKFLFAGTGVNLIVRKAGNGGVISWRLDDGSTSGTVDCFAAALEQQVSVPLASGLTNTLHTVEITATLPTPGTVALIDGFDVEGSTTRTRVDDSDVTKISYSAGWTHGDTSLNSPAEAPGGSITYVLAAGETLSYSFTGKAVALQLVPRQDSLAFNWSIDSGAYTGTVDPQPVAAAGHIAGGIWYRYPFILRNDLLDGPHTLTLTSTNAAAGVNFIGCFDAIDSLSFIPVPVELSTFAAE